MNAFVESRSNEGAAFHVKEAEAKHMPWLMASNPRRPFGILLRLRHPSRRFKEMLLALSYTAALLGLFWFMNKVADDHGISSGITGSVLR